MNTLQFSLFFVALLVGYILVHVRLARFESYLREIAGLKLLNERLKGVSDVLERVRLDHIEDQLGQLHDDLVALQELGSRIERASGRAGTSSEPAPIGAAGTATTSDRIRAAVESRLLALGYGSLHILSDLAEASLDEPMEVRVECTKGHMAHKGTVVTRNGGVVDVRLQAVGQAFP
jgi:hypothetical protein